MNRSWPIAVRMLDVSEPLRPVEGIARYPRVRLFVRHGDDLLGSVDIPTWGTETVPVERLRDVIARKFAKEIFARDFSRQMQWDQRPEALAPTSLSVIVPSCDREADLRRLLASLMHQRTRHSLEIIVVDNRPSVGVARRVAGEFSSVRVIDEARPGLSFARNAGIAAARGEIIVATDDDVVAPGDWLEKLAAPFARPQVVGVTGQVLPLELDTTSQCVFETYGGLGKGYEWREFNRGWFDGRATAVPTWEIGATANAAFRRSIFSQPAIGLLDPALGAGTPTGCSEDTYLFYRILKAGGTMVYTPHAFVWHRHRDSSRSGRQQIYAYSKGHVAYHLTTWMRDRDRRALLSFVYSLPRAHVERAVLRLLRRSEYPLSLILVEVAGNLAGPLALWRARRRARALSRHSTPTERLDVVPMEGPVSQAPASEPVVASLPDVARRHGRQLQPPA